MSPIEAVLTGLAGIGVGAISALFGIGGGIVMVPFLVLGFEEPQQLAEGTSLVVIVPTALAGAIAHHRNGYVRLRAAGVVATVGLAASVFGATVALNLSSEALRRGFAAVIVVIAARLIKEGVSSNSAGTRSGPRS